MIGIYRIRNLNNNKCYYGSAKDIKRRWSKHKSQLKYQRHENIILQRAWNKYGEEVFVFEVVELCDVDDLLNVEQKYLDLNPEYNMGKQASGGDNLSNHPNKSMIVENRKINNRLWIDDLTQEERKRIWSRPKNINGRWKGGVSENNCLSCGKLILPSSVYCVGCVRRDGENNPFYNKHHSEETKKKLSESRKGKYNGSQNIPFEIDGVEYCSLGDASNKLGVPIPTIRWRLKSKNKRFEKYKYLNHE